MRKRATLQLLLATFTLTSTLSHKKICRQAVESPQTFTSVSTIRRRPSWMATQLALRAASIGGFGLARMARTSRCSQPDHFVQGWSDWSQATEVALESAFGEEVTVQLAPGTRQEQTFAVNFEHPTAFWTFTLCELTPKATEMVGAVLRRYESMACLFQRLAQHPCNHERGRNKRV